MPGSARAAEAAFSPLDERLGLLRGKASPALAEKIALLGSELPYIRAARMLQGLLGLQFSVSTVRRITMDLGKAARKAEELAVTVLESDPGEACVGAQVQQVKVDGAMIRRVGGAFAEVRTMVIGELQLQAEGAAQATKLSYFSLLADAKAFNQQATLEIYRRGTDNGRMVVAVNDGAEWIDEVVALHYPEAIRILDWAHASGYLHAAGHAVDGSCGGACQRLLDELGGGTPERVLELLADLIRQQESSEPVRTILEQSASYLSKRTAQLRYPQFRAAGLPIGSGIVESANKNIVQVRLKRPGMSWQPENANAILTLRCADQNGHWQTTVTSALESLRIRCRERRRAGRRARCHQKAEQAAKAVGAKATAQPYFANGRPTANHPYNRYPAVRPKTVRRRPPHGRGKI